MNGTSEQWLPREKDYKENEKSGDVPENKRMKEDLVDEETNSKDYNSVEDLTEQVNVPEEVQVRRRSNRLRKKPIRYEDYAVLTLNAELFVDDIPECYDYIYGGRMKKNGGMQFKKR